MKRTLLASIIIGVLGAPTAFAAPGPLAEVKVDVLEDNQPVRDVLRRLEERHGLNYVVSEQVLSRAGTVTVRLRGVPLDLALEAICSAAGLSCELRGPLVVIVPKEPGARPALPNVEHGVVPDSRPAPNDPTSDVPPPPARAEDPLQAMGKLEEIDLENRRVQLRIDGVKRDFYLPTSGVGLQVSNLESAVGSLKPGSRVAFLYKRDESGRSVITDLIGGTRPPRGARTRPAGAPRDEAADIAPIETQQQTRRLRPAQTDQPDVPLGPEVPAPAEASNLPLPEGALAGKLVGREGEIVRILRGDGEVFELHVPPADDSGRRERVMAAIDTLRADDQLLVTYEDKDGVRYIKDTITGRAR